MSTCNAVPVSKSIIFEISKQRDRIFELPHPLFQYLTDRQCFDILGKFAQTTHELFYALCQLLYVQISPQRT